uniref:Uncharacterized protein n=1 Tax=Siphoviridae sp. ctfZQ2 TaxID=2826415 RepID=A0A8S5NC20_9CAUD|nr:MAG TPA: hypothetical protein [Siphoviridae sp. ctfZQ2]
MFKFKKKPLKVKTNKLVVKINHSKSKQIS